MGPRGRTGVKQEGGPTCQGVGRVQLGQKGRRLTSRETSGQTNRTQPSVHRVPRARPLSQQNPHRRWSGLQGSAQAALDHPVWFAVALS